MASTYNDLQEAIVGFLRGQAIAGIVWGDHDSPAYQEFPEPTRPGAPLDPFPYVSFDIETSSIEQTFTNDDVNSGHYTETMVVVVSVVAYQSAIATLASPYATGSVGSLLDGLAKVPSLLDGANFSVIGWERKGWMLTEDKAARGVYGQRVYEATLSYEAILEAAYPNAPT